MPAIDKLLPTSVIGSYATPGWLWTALEEIKAGRYGPGASEMALR